jgi:hypothetical protein
VERTPLKFILTERRYIMKINLNPVHGFSYNQLDNHNFTFALINRVGRILHSPFMCKDYLQDIFWCEYLKKDLNLYGLKWSSGMLNLDQKRFGLAIISGKENMRRRAKILKGLLNMFEDAQGIDYSIVSETDDDNIIVVNFSREWTRCGPLLSAFITLIRISGPYDGGDFIDFLEGMDELRRSKSSYSIDPDYSKVDINRLGYFKDKLVALLNGEKIEHEWSMLKTREQAHNTGIMTFKWDIKEK